MQIILVEILSKSQTHSFVRMQLQRLLAGQPGVEDAGVVMGTGLILATSQIPVPPGA